METIELVFGWYFEETNTACTFPEPLPAWVFDISGALTDLILFLLCGQF